VKILIIEDEKISLKLACAVLTTAGHHIAQADAADKALAEICNNKPEIVLMDLALPGMNGLELTRKLKSDAQTRDIIIIAVTAFPDTFSKQAAMAAGCDAYITKPLDTRALPQQINDLVSRYAGKALKPQQD
jgi:two-component system, cell cycle response regulator